jgi:predicted RNA-binding protein with PUA-like domain
VDVEALRPAKVVVPLAKVKADKRFAAFALVTQGRLSVMPVPDALAAVLREWAGL